MALSNLACGTPLQDVLNILSHARLIVMLLKDEEVLSFPKMPYQGAFMNLPNEQLS